MNILFFLTPKQDVAYIYDDFTLRQALEKMEHHRYSSIPVLNRKGEYVGTMTEGDLLWGIKNQNLKLENAEDIPIRSIPRKRDYKPVSVNTQMDELVAAAMTQNFVPVLDDKKSFIGLVKRNAIIQYCYDRYRAVAPMLNKKTQMERQVL
ncbi:CBS domain-containing protein [Allofournierella sp.]|uniref:CBS domain-containing protein n=1 Tax=Allofournierella sp. TaxID=1940256 RepID=UPI0015AA7D65|nr:CBS domain-containing protein [Oscillospiraceae bacterium]